MLISSYFLFKLWLCDLQWDLWPQYTKFWQVFQSQKLIGKSLRGINSTVFWQSLLSIVNLKWPQILCNPSYQEVESAVSGPALWLWPMEYGEVTLWDFLAEASEKSWCLSFSPTESSCHVRTPQVAYYRGQCGGNRRCPTKSRSQLPDTWDYSWPFCTSWFANRHM